MTYPVVAILTVAGLLGCAGSVEQQMAKEESAATGKTQQVVPTTTAKSTYVPDEAYLQVEKCDQPPEAVERVAPVYSWDMMQNKAEGHVSARLFVGSDGTVKNVEIFQDIGFDSAERSRQALMGYKFLPARKGGKKVATFITMTVSWRLPR